MNNKPITARVKSGMFKTKEPLLNVGPAGVDGNNTTRTMPSPSKMKGYTMKSSPFKQEVNAADKAIGNSKNAQYIVGPNGELSARSTTTVVTPGEDAFVEGTPDVITEPTETFTGEMATGADAEKWAKQNDYCKGKPKGTPGCAGFHKFEGGATVAGTPDKTVKGEDKKTEVSSDKKIYRKVEGRASSAYATRNNLRKAKVAARNAKKYQRKQDKADRRKDPTLDAKEQRRARKETASQSIKKVADSEMLNATTQSAQGQSAFDTSQRTRLQDVEDTAGSLTRDEQKNAGEGVAKMKNPGFFKKKSPMKMNYFKK